jgi:hypothetical protein
MKLTLLFLVVGMLVFSGNRISANQNAEEAGVESAVVEFTDKTKLGDEILLGQYFFEHDDKRMARGEPCMYVYGYEQGKPGKLVVSFHCKPVERSAVRDVVITVAMTKQADLFELKEIQFKNSKKGHLIP